ncbi:hypothetical protein niasHT_034877 [Heterodera trifolii]|uniref:Uncharacterized protein n=1 Tax=Heterodera trifolii TaxID=157864 RepID=A0ABD2I9L8_9BILA
MRDKSGRGRNREEEKVKRRGREREVQKGEEEEKREVKKGEGKGMRDRSGRGRKRKDEKGEEEEKGKKRKRMRDKSGRGRERKEKTEEKRKSEVKKGEGEEEIEVNGSAIGGLASSELTTKLHQRILSKLGLNLENSVENRTLSNTVEALYKACLTLDENDFSLRLDQQHYVAVVFNQQIMLNKRPELMEIRRIIERSTAIVLSEPGMVERFFPNPEEAPLIKAIRDTYAKMWRIEENENNEQFSELIKRVKKQPNNFVMKKTEYALWDAWNRKVVKKIYFGEEILETMANFGADQRLAYILMEKLRPKSVKNHIIWAENEKHKSGGDFFEEVTPELGIFGTLLGNIANGEVLYNAQIGHKLRTKLASANACGIENVKTAYDTAYLVD